MRNLQIHRAVRRSSKGILAVVGYALAAVALPTYGAYKQTNPARAGAAPAPVRYTITCDGRRIPVRSRRPLDPSAFHWFGGIAAVMGVVTELRIRRQLDLARRGSVAEAIVDEVHHKSHRHDRNWMKYGFIAADGLDYRGKCTLDALDVLALSSGSRTAVFYDPADPRRNIPELGLWAVAWDSWDEPAA